MPALGREEVALLAALQRHQGPTPTYLRVFLPLGRMCSWQRFTRLWPGQQPDWAWSAPARAGRVPVAGRMTLVGRRPIAQGTPSTWTHVQRSLQRFVRLCAPVAPGPPGGWAGWPLASVAWPFDPRARRARPWAARDAGWRAFALLLCAQGPAGRERCGATWLAAVPAPLRAWQRRGGALSARARAALCRLGQQQRMLALALRRAEGRRPPPDHPARRADRFGVLRAAPAAAYLARVQAAVRDIGAGRLDKVVLARMRIVRPAPGQVFSAWDTALRLRQQHPQARIFLHALHGGGAFVGASPETLIERRAGALFTHALAGTAPIQGGDVAAAAQALQRSDKDRREHAWVVTALRDALRALGVALSPPAGPQVLRAGAVVHLETPFMGRAPSQLDLVALASRLHPTPALAGTPRGQALARLRREEPWRGLYGGAIGWWAGNGDGHLAVAIRSALCTPSGAALFAGAGIVRGSEPAAEWRETHNKLAAMQAAVAPQSTLP